MANRLIYFLLIAGSAATTLVGSRQTEARDNLGFDVSNLGGWTQVNPQPYYISSKVDIQCVAPKPTDYERERKQNPHASTYITVFVNEAGRPAMFANPSQRFPKGAVIIKRKFEENSQNGTPILSTIMIKRETGYNPEAGDWEFVVVSGDGKNVEAKGRLGNCMGCHASRRETDFVFRSYLPTRFRLK
jgi:Cytochrome P460